MDFYKCKPTYVNQLHKVITFEKAFISASVNAIKLV